MGVNLRKDHYHKTTIITNRWFRGPFVFPFFLGSRRGVLDCAPHPAFLASPAVLGPWWSPVPNLPTANLNMAVLPTVFSGGRHVLHHVSPPPHFIYITQSNHRNTTTTRRASSAGCACLSKRHCAACVSL